MTNDVEIHVRWTDDGGRALAGLTGQAKRAGGEAGNEWSGSFSGKLKSAPPAVIKADVDPRLAQAKLKELGAKKNAVVVQYDADVKKATARIESLEAKRGSTKIDVDAEVAKAKAKIEALTATKNRVLLELDVDPEPAARKVRKAAEDVEKATEKVAKRTQAQFEGLKFTALSAGLPAAAAVGAAGVTAALLAPEALFLGLGAAALKGNGQVADSYGALKEHVVGDTQQMAGVLAGPVAQSANDLGASFDRMKPQIRSAMVESRDAVADLTGTVTDFAENAMPGMVGSIKSAAPTIKGLRTFAGEAGAGLSEMFVNASKGSQAAGQSMATFGGIVRDAEGFVGNFIANLATGSTGVLPQFAGTLHQAEDVVLSLSSRGMPALQGATNGVLGTVSGGLGVVNAFASGLGTWTQPLGSAAGQLFATNSAAKLFGTSLGETGFGLKAFATQTDEAGNKTSRFRTAVGEADGAGGKFKAGLSTLIGSGLNPLGVALVAGGFILNAFGESQQRAAEQAAAHKENVRELTDAIRADNGVLGQHVNAVNVQALADKNAAGNLSVFSSNMGEAKLAIQGNAVAYQALSNKGAEALRQTMSGTGAANDQIDAYSKLGQQALETGQSYDQLTKGVGASVFAYDAEGNAIDVATDAQKQHGAAIINGLGAIGEQINAQRQAHEEYLQAEHALSGLTSAQIENRDATIKATQAMYDQQNAALGYRGAVLNAKAALEEYTKVSQDGGATEDQKASSLLKVEMAFAAQEQAAYKAAYSNSTAATESGKLAEANRAADAELVKLANSFAGPLPESMQQTISKMSLAQAQAAHLTVEVDGAGNAVYRLPDGKTVRISADTGQAQAAIAEVKRLQDSLYNKTVTNTIINRTVNLETSGQAYQPSLTGRRAAGAAGGLVAGLPVKQFAGGGQIDGRGGGLFSGPGTGTSDDLVVRASNREFIVSERGVQGNLGLLQDINAGKVRSYAQGGMVQAEDGSWVPPSFYDSAPKGPHAKYSATGFAKLASFAQQNGFSALDASDQEQLRTYGGWTDPAPASTSAPRSSSGWRSSKGGSGGATAVLEVRSSGNAMDDFLAEMIRRYVQARGGDVQGVFGG